MYKILQLQEAYISHLNSWVHLILVRNMWCIARLFISCYQSEVTRMYPKQMTKVRMGQMHWLTAPVPVGGGGCTSPTQVFCWAHSMQGWQVVQVVRTTQCGSHDLLYPGGLIRQAQPCTLHGYGSNSSSSLPPPTLEQCKLPPKRSHVKMDNFLVRYF